MQSAINIPSSYLEYREGSFLQMFVAETSSELTKCVASFWSPRQYYPASLLFSPRLCDKVLAGVSGHTDVPPIKPLVLFFMFFLL